MEKEGDNGFGFEETPESEDYSKFSTYLTLKKECGYSHSEALKFLRISQEEYERLYKKYLPDLELE
ncbi:MAG: hypothetical protein M0R16_01845 [Bacteroidales bacterium]|jgi:hypothetical protein|nr:hypothetical protein [Bacteroidales bacterium]